MLVSVVGLKACVGQIFVLCHDLLFPEVQVRGVGQPSWKSMPPLAALQHDLCSLPSTNR